MAKHKCGSCHFFQEAGLAGSGWCHHPQRKVSSGVLIMVRRNELACRDEWSRDLWRPRDAVQPDGDLPSQRPTSGPLPPALAENLRSVLDHGSALAASARGEDVLLSEARIVSDPQESWEPEPRPFPAGNFDPRTAIFRAREAYRERARAKAAAERQSAGAEAITETPIPQSPTYASLDDAAAEPAQDQPRETAAADARFSGESTEYGSWSRGSIAPLTILTDPEFPISDEATGGENRADTVLVANESDAEHSIPDEAPIPALGERTEVEEREVPATENTYFAVRRVEGTETEAFPDWYRSDLPRICRTCRDYRPSVDGERGWCANSWAFTHRRVVLEDDPAPCQSAIGDWWLPVDDIWLVAADVSSHGRPTPLLDRLSAKGEQQRRRS